MNQLKLLKAEIEILKREKGGQNENINSLMKNIREEHAAKISQVKDLVGQLTDLYQQKVFEDGTAKRPLDLTII